QEPNDLINEAVRWLRGEAPYQYPGNSTGNVDPNGNNVLSAGTSSAFEYNTSTSVKAFTSDANFTAVGTQVLTSPLQAWQKYVDVATAAGTSWGTAEANGEGLKNALMYWNDGHLVT